jgi:hypothetical protein
MIQDDLRLNSVEMLAAMDRPLRDVRVIPSDQRMLDPVDVVCVGAAACKQCPGCLPPAIP